MQVAIDGPAGAGKTSVGREIARQFSLLFIQSGKLYRALAYGKINGIELDSLSLEPGEGAEAELLIGDESVTEELDTEEIGEEASKMAKLTRIRNLVNDTIIEIARERSVLVEGRDIGTAVLTDADIKIYLTADIEERARRRGKQLGVASEKEILEKMISRDNRDQDRDIAPLKAADDAFIIDSTNLALSETVNEVCDIIDRELSSNEKI